MRRSLLWKRQLRRIRQSSKRKPLKIYGGMFQMPCPGYTRISDDYGNRMHPTLKVQKFHNGVDFAAPSGTAILAAYSGNVVAASYNSSMGNYVMIDHGDGLYTIYMHASKLYVSTGQSVSKGATIAAVGSTGRSTGPHLHFYCEKQRQLRQPVELFEMSRGNGEHKSGCLHPILCLTFPLNHEKAAIYAVNQRISNDFRRFRECAARRNRRRLM